MSVVIAILAMIIILGVLIVAHEFGHFIAARICKIRVHEFAIGMGPKLWKKQGKRTLFTVRAIPIGGFCSMGEDDETDKEDAEAFPNHPKRHRVFVLVAGSAMNIIVGFLILLIVMFTEKTRTLPVIKDLYTGERSAERIAEYQKEFQDYGIIELPDVNDVYDILANDPEMDAALKNLYRRYAGYEPSGYIDHLQEGDRLIAVNGKRLYSVNYINAFLGAGKNGRQKIVFEHNGKKMTREFEWLTLLGRADNKRLDPMFRDAYGIIEFETEPYTFGTRFVDTGKKSLEMVQLVTFSLGQLFTGKADVSDLKGPVGMADTMNQVVGDKSTSTGFKLQTLLFFAALIAINLAVVNMLPLPALDGGRILFILIEVIIRRKIPAKYEGIIHFSFFVLLLLLMAFIFYGDIARIVKR